MRWGDGPPWYPTSKKEPAPEHGIRMKKAGTTWWGQRWIDALTRVLAGDAGRLSRGRTYARAGRAHDLTLVKGSVNAKVTGSRPSPYRVSITVAELPEAVWSRVIAAMAAKAQFTASLLAGEMPPEINEAFEGAGASLFPRDRADLRTNCSCPDDGDPCKHIAATHYILGEALDRDPFLLFELRGRTKQQVLEALRDARARGGVEAEAGPKGGAEARPQVGVRLEQVAAVDYERPPEPLPALSFSFDAPVAHGAVLRQLGAPASWSAEESPADALAPVVRAAAEVARRIALGELDEGPGAEVARAEGERAGRAEVRADPRGGAPARKRPRRSR